MKKVIWWNWIESSTFSFHHPIWCLILLCLKTCSIDTQQICHFNWAWTKYWVYKYVIQYIFGIVYYHSVCKNNIIIHCKSDKTEVILSMFKLVISQYLNWTKAWGTRNIFLLRRYKPSIKTLSYPRQTPNLFSYDPYFATFLKYKIFKLASLLLCHFNEYKLNCDADQNKTIDITF